jgi:hypothetical protein
MIPNSNRELQEERMAKRTHGAERARLDDLGSDPGQVGPESAGQSRDPKNISPIESAANQSAEELADTDQALEAGIVEGVEDAGDHPERPVRTHLDYGRPDDLPQRRRSEESDEPELNDDRIGSGDGEAKDVDIENLAAENSEEDDEDEDDHDKESSN